MAIKRAEELGAGDLKHRVRFERRQAIDDGAGNEESGAWLPQFTRSAYIALSKGGESVMAARLQGTSPALIVVRFDSSSRQITPDWRAVELHGDGRETVYAIRQAQDMERQRRWMTILCESGVAA